MDMANERMGWVRLGLGAALVLALAAWALNLGGSQARAAGAGSKIFITLKDDFIDKYKLLATIDADFKVIKAGKVNPADKDGDMHVAGWSDDIGLPTVAEIMNAKDQNKAVGIARAAQGKAAIKITGAWRIWCEHAGGGPQVQGKKVNVTSTNPDHVFEVHPLTKVGAEDVSASFKPIDGFTPKKAHDAFTHYENVACKITHDDTNKTTTVQTSMAGYNYVKFMIESVDDTEGGLDVKDGRFVRCNVLDLDGDLLVRDVRMVFVKGTPPEAKGKALKKDGRLTVLGIPRLDLSLVKFRVDNASKDRFKDRDLLNWNLPYEMIIVGVYPDE
jgi:hypothetical protein